MVHVAMSIALAVKNLQRRLRASIERSELTKVCGHELWRSLGFDALDGLDDVDKPGLGELLLQANGRPCVGLLGMPWADPRR